MRLTRKQLNNLIKNFLNENLGLDSSSIQGKIYFAYRNITGTENIAGDIFPGLKAGHAWVMVEDPSTGKLTSYSGKSGIDFELPDIAKRLTLGRDNRADSIFQKVNSAYSRGEVSKEVVMSIIEETDWKNLRKLKDWESDQFEKADTVIEVMPRYDLGDNQEKLINSIMMVEKAFQSYQEDLPYDPIPGSESAIPEARNSNSFAYTLLRSFLNENEIRERIGNLSIKLPGWGLEIKSMLKEN